MLDQCCFAHREWKQNVALNVNLAKIKQDRWMIGKHWRMKLVVNIYWLSRIKNLFILATVRTLIIAAVCWTRWLECSSSTQEVCFFPVTSCNMWLVFILLQWLLTFGERAKFLKYIRKSLPILLSFLSIARCLWLFLTHQVILLYHKPRSLMLSKIFWNSS